MDTGFSRYEPSGDKKVLVKDRVLFGDKEDVKVKHANDRPAKSRGGTIMYILRRSTPARPGNYCHGKVYVNGGKSWLHVVHHETIDGTKLGKLLCTLDGYSGLKMDNVWSRYDWCHYINWGDESSDDTHVDDGGKKRFDHNLYFYPYEGEGKFTLDDGCIEGDWRYGVRLCDPKTKLAYAYVFGDVFVNDELCGEKVCEQRKKTDFNIDPTPLMVDSANAN